MKKKKVNNAIFEYRSIEEINAKFFPKTERERVTENYSTPQALGQSLALQALKRVKI